MGKSSQSTLVGQIARPQRHAADITTGSTSSNPSVVASRSACRRRSWWATTSSSDRSTVSLMVVAPRTSVAEARGSSSMSTRCLLMSSRMDRDGTFAYSKEEALILAFGQQDHRLLDGQRVCCPDRCFRRDRRPRLTTRPATFGSGPPRGAGPEEPDRYLRPMSCGRRPPGGRLFHRESR